MGRNIGAGVAGIVVAGLIIWLIEMVGHTIYPLPEGFNYEDQEAMSAYVSTLPVGALLAVVIAWVVGTFGGTVAACRIGTAPDYIFAMLVGGFVLLGITFNLTVIPHPTWMAVTGVTGTIVAAWLGMRVSKKKAAAE